MATCKDLDSGSDQITQPCDYCSNVSDGYCHDCEMFMCQACFDKHTKARPCRHHVLVDNSSKPDMKDKCSKTCVRHPLQINQFYCVDHKLVGCSQCFFPGHRYCRFEEIQEAAKEFHDRGDDSRLKDKLHELERKHSEYRNQCDEDKEAVSVMNTQVVNDVKSFKKDVIAFAKQVEAHALEEAERLRIDNKTLVEKRMSELDNVGENIEQCLVKLGKQPTVDEFFIAAIEVKPEVEKLEQKLTSIEGLGAVKRYIFTPRSDVMEMIQDVRSCREIQVVPVLNCSREAHRLIVKHHNTEIESIAKTYEQYNVQIISPVQYGTFEIKGTEDGIRLARTKLQELLRRVQKLDHTIDKPGLGEYIGTPKGKDSLNTVESSYPVVITQKTNDDDDGDGFEFEDAHGGDAVGGSGVTGIEIKTGCKLYDTRQIYCGTGDITETNVEVIVNTANETLSFAGDLRKTILRKGGTSIKKECEAYIKSYGKLSVCEAFMSSAGNLKAHYIVHIRGPAWKGGTNSEEDMLEEAVFKCMQMASSKGATSIAIPAISCGISGYPVQKATSTIVASVKNYFREAKDSTVTKVYLCDVKSETVEAFSNAMSSHIGPVQRGISKCPAVRENKSGATLSANSVTFVIRSLDGAKINEAIKKLEYCIDRDISSQDFYDDIIKKFDDAQARDLLHIVKKYQLNVKLDRPRRHICIDGFNANVNSATNEIHQLLRRAQLTEKDKKAAELMASLVQWFFIEISDTGQNLTKYEKGLNYRIEAAFTFSGSPNIAFETDDGRKYIIDFSDMIEYPEGAKDTDQIPVIRREPIKHGNFEAPALWSIFTGNQEIVTLHSTDKEYSTLEKTFLNSAGKGFVVTKIERIINKTLWTQYQAKRKSLEEQNPKGTQNERLLWHGTAPEAVDNINAHGFNRSFCGKNDAYYGDGVYFAVKADYSTRDTYSRPDAFGVKRMFCCLVLTGEYTQGKKGMRVAPKKCSDGVSLYDSVVDNQHNPNMFIIFSDTQAYPEYLITFKKA